MSCKATRHQIWRPAHDPVDADGRVRSLDVGLPVVAEVVDGALNGDVGLVALHHGGNPGPEDDRV